MGRDPLAPAEAEAKHRRPSCSWCKRTAAAPLHTGDTTGPHVWIKAVTDSWMHSYTEVSFVTLATAHISISASAAEGANSHIEKPLIARDMCAHERMQVSAARGGTCAWMWLEALAATAGSALPPPPHGPPLGQTPSALINVAINQAGADIGVISPQCRGVGGDSALIRSDWMPVWRLSKNILR